MSKLTWIVIIAVVIVGAVWYLGRNNSGAPMYGTSYSPTPSSSGKSSSSGSKSNSAIVTATPASNPDYTGLIRTYAGRLVQFDATCHGRPDMLSVKNGTKIMLDNRSADTKVIKLDNNSYTLPGYSYRIVTVSSSELPYNLGIDCKSVNATGENISTVNVQASILNVTQ